VIELGAHTKFFMHWAWRIFARMQSANASLLSGNIPQARATADSSLQSALAVADPELRALAWELNARVSLVEGDLSAALDSIQQALAVIDKFQIPVAAWQTFATAWQVYQHARELKTAENYRVRSESCIRKIADSFAPEEPLRATFLAADPVRKILLEKETAKTTRRHKPRTGAAT
jgi:tetratricopeptide (TPR) repeat protein